MSIKDDYNFLIINQKFPKIGLGLDLRWGTAEFEVYVHDLLTDTKSHTRQGFPQEIHDSLQALLLIHHKLFPGKRMQSNDLWDSTYGDLK